MKQLDIASYHIARRESAPEAAEAWDGPFWRDAPPLDVGHFHHASTDHRPRTQAKLAHTDEAIHVFFRVEDRYVLSRRTELHATVCRDSCVEFFVEPLPGKGYFNIEINCGGTMLLFFIEDETPTPEGFKRYTRVPAELAERITITPSMPSRIDEEITDPCTWTLRYTIPLSLFEHYLGRLGPLGGRQWRGNFYKCADESSHPHWASWSPIGEVLSFHLPRTFGELHFE